MRTILTTLLLCAIISLHGCGTYTTGSAEYWEGMPNDNYADSLGNTPSPTVELNSYHGATQYPTDRGDFSHE